MSEYINKLQREILPKINNIQNINILELGVQRGTSTNIFLEICEKNEGYLTSVDIDDCSKVSDSDRWKFIHSRDDDFSLIRNNINKEVDVIFIDTLHEADHVEKIIYGYYDLLKVGGYLFIDDISHLPYLTDKPRNNFYCEINNKETFEKIIEIYSSNTDKFDLNFNFLSSGLATLKKKNQNNLDKSKKILDRKFTLKNLYRKFKQITK
jgi:predicted O-methyltransferase YrrM